MINIYIQTNIKGPKAKAGKGLYLLEAQTSKGPATLTKTIDFECETENGAEIKTLLAAVGRINRPSEIVIHTDTHYTASACELGWTESWAANGWKTKKGEEVAYREEWQRLLWFLKTHTVSWRVQQPHEYKDWMQRRIDRQKGEGNV